jgi:hypothetical protein
VRALLVAAAALSLLAGACTITPNSPSDAGPVDATATGTIGDQCTRVFTALCQRDISVCGASFDLNTCVMSGVTQCCGGTCSHAAISSDTTIDACVQAVSAEDCNSIVNNAIPAACAGVPRTQ